MAKKQINCKIVCDTNVFINFLQKEEQTVLAMENIGIDNIVMPIISALELCKGSGNKDELKKIQEFINCYINLSKIKRKQD